MEEDFQVAKEDSLLVLGNRVTAQIFFTVEKQCLETDSETAKLIFLTKRLATVFELLLIYLNILCESAF